MAHQLDIKVDTPACTGCHLCEIVCSLYHENLINPDKARIRIADKWDESLFVPHICQLCDSPDCVEACGMSALSQDSDGIIRVDMELCSGCEACVSACPHEAIRWSNEFGRLYVCDRCDGDPMCVKFCSVKALELIGSIQIDKNISGR